MRKIFVLELMLFAAACGPLTEGDELGAMGSQLATGLPHNIPDYCDKETVRSVATGNWSNPAIWSTGKVPGALDAVVISDGTIVTYDLVSSVELASICVHDNGVLRFKATSATRLVVGTLEVMMDGVLEIGTEAAPVAAGVKAEVIFADRPIDTGFDPEQFGNGLIGLGKVTIVGAKKGPTFARLAAEPAAGALALQLAEAVSGWAVGDRLYLPDSKAFSSTQDEEVTVAAISADGKTLTLAGALKFAHPGARDVAGALSFLPHVANLTRNVVLRSANPAGVRGHVIFVHRASVNLQYAQLKDLGRTTSDPLDSTTFDSAGAVAHLGTNQIGRYALHLHHLFGPVNPTDTGYQYKLIGLEVEQARKWGIAVHDSHYGLLQQNVVYDTPNAPAIVTEDGSESYNVFEKNFVGRVTATGFFKTSLSGDGFWFAGTNNYVRDNVVANAKQFAFDIFLQHFKKDTGDDRLAPIPLFRGADMMNPAQVRLVDMRRDQAFLQFDRNEAYKSETGLNIWDIGVLSKATDVLPQTVVRDFHVWNHRNDAVFVYNADTLVVENLVVRGDISGIREGRELDNSIARGAGFTNVRKARRNLIRGADIQGQMIGIDVPSNLDLEETFVVESSYLRNATNVWMSLPKSRGGKRRVTVRSTRFASLPFVPSSAPPQLDFRMEYRPASALGGSDQYSYVEQNALRVEDYNGVGTDDFGVYFREQAPAFVVPQTAGNIEGAPEAGLTNQQAWAKYGVAIAGAVAPCTVARAGVTDGWVCP